MMKYPQRPCLLTTVPPQVSMKQHRDEAVSVRIAMKQYSSWKDVPIEVIRLMHQEHAFRCIQEAMQMGTDETDDYYSMLMGEFLRNEKASLLRCFQAYHLTQNSSKESWQQRKWCRVCGLNTHIYIDCSFCDFTTGHNLSTFKMKFQPDIIIDLILAACKSRGHLSNESGSSAINLRTRIMRERAEFLKVKLFSNDKYHKYFQPLVSEVLSATSISKLPIVSSFAMNTVDDISPVV